MDARIDALATAWLTAMRPSFEMGDEPSHMIVWEEARAVAMGFLAMYDAAHQCCAMAAAVPAEVMVPMPVEVPAPAPVAMVPEAIAPPSKKKTKDDAAPAANNPEPAVVEAAPTVDPAETGSADAAPVVPAASTQE